MAGEGASRSYLHEEVHQEAAQRLEGAFHGLQLFSGRGKVEAGQERVQALGFYLGALVQPQRSQTRHPPYQKTEAGYQHALHSKSGRASGSTMQEGRA